MEKLDCNPDNLELKLKENYEQACQRVEETEREVKHYQALINIENCLQGEIEWIADIYYDDYDPEAAQVKKAELVEAHRQANEDHQEALKSKEFAFRVMVSRDYGGLE